MISIILTSRNEPKTIGRAIEFLLHQKIGSFELIVVAPDDGTLNVARRYAAFNKSIRFLRDPGNGKPAALNLAFSQAKGSICILTDGDVYVKKNSIHHMIKKFDNPEVGAVSGRVMSAMPSSSMFGFWAYITAESFHNLRMNQNKDGSSIICSGYLYAIRRDLINSIPLNALADDAYISLKIAGQGYSCVYEPRSCVFVQYPSTLPDWIRQKKRTAARIYQLSHFFKFSRKKELLGEILAAFRVAHFIKNPKEAFEFALLALFRLYIWGRIYFDIRLQKRSFSSVWQRVESTK